MGMMLYLASLTVFHAFVGLYHVIHQCLRWNVLNFFGNTGFVSLVCLRKSFLIVIQSLLVVFGRSYVNYWSVE